MRFFFTALTSVLFAALALVFLVWLIFAPQGRISPVVENIQDDQLRYLAIKVFNKSQAESQNLLDSWARIEGYLTETNVERVNERVQSYKDIPELADVLDFQLEFTFERENSYRASIKFLVIPILEALYDTFGITDYELVFFDGSRTDSTLEFDLQILPGKTRRKKLVSQSNDNELDAAKQLGTYIATIAGRDRFSIWEIWFNRRYCERNICVEELPSSVGASLALRKGYEVLLGALPPKNCASGTAITDQQRCKYRTARAHFDEVMELVDQTSLAHLGKAIAAFKEAKLMVDRGDHSEHEIGNVIVGGIVSLEAAKENNLYVKHLIDSDGLSDVVGEEVVSTLDLNKDFLTSAYNYVVATTEFSNARYSQIIEQLSLIRRAPPYVSSLIDWVRYAARVYQVENLEDGVLLLDEIQNSISPELVGDWQYHYLLASAVCTWPFSTSDMRRDAQKDIDLARAALPAGDRFSNPQLLVAEGLCAGNSGDLATANRIIDQLLGDAPASEEICELNEDNNIEKRREIGIFLLFAAEVSAAAGQFDQTSDFLTRSINCDKRWWRFSQNSPIFDHFNASRAGRNFQAIFRGKIE